MEQIFYFQDQVSITVEDAEIVKPDSDSEAEFAVQRCPRFGVVANNRLMLQRVEEGSSDYEVVKRSFVSGMGDFGKSVGVVEIQRKNYDWNVMDNARVEAFRVFAAAVANTNDGDANIKYAWYGGSRDEIREILLYGFRRFENRPTSYGRGVYLSPAKLPMESVKTAVADSDGLRQILLCRVILGKPEAIYFSLQQDQPSSLKFNSGVDDLSSPTKYVIWEPYMNTHILPVFIISFRADFLRGFEALRKPASPHMSVNGLMRQLTNHLSSADMAFVHRSYHEFQTNKISRPAFIRRLRAIAGDDVLMMIVRSLK